MNTEKISLQNNNELILFKVFLERTKFKLNEITMENSQQEDVTHANKCADNGMRDLLCFLATNGSKSQLTEEIGKYVSKFEIPFNF